MTDISKAIQSLNTKGGNSHEYVMNATPTNEAEYKSLVKFVESQDANGNAVFSSTQPYTWSQVSTEQAALQTTYDGLAYARARAKAYAEIKEQLDLLYHDMAADKGDKTGEWFKHIKAVKDANSKG
tara:strand:+ start:205 stop:582 length:378 start_codon:yes stop_codon:yes gene_type:complete